jgi:hypothetical protein
MMKTWTLILACLALGCGIGCGSNGDDAPGSELAAEGPRCGNGNVEVGEVCDDGNTDPCVGGCSANCLEVVQLSGCGDGVVCGTEVCDDGNQLDTEGTCSADCSVNELCPDGTATLSTGTVDPIDLSGCTTIVGDLSVGDEITSLAGLERLERLEGTLTLTLDVPSLAPIASLTSVQELVVNEATSTTLTGLEGLTSAPVITIRDNPRVTDLSALNHISGELESLRVSGNPMLSSLSGLGGITGVTGDLTVRDNELLQTLAGFEGVTHVGGSVVLEKLPALTNVDALSSLTEVGGDLIIGYDLGDTDLTFLTNLDGLSQLVSVGGELAVRKTSVSTLAPLANVEAVGWVTIDENSSLTSVGGAFDKVTYMPGTVRFYDNWDLVTLDGFASLQSLDGALWITGSGLESITGLGQLTEVCAALPEEDEYLASAWGCLFVSTNYSLVDISGFSSLQVVHGTVSLDLDSVSDLSPLDALTTIEGDLTFGGLHSVTDLSGMNALTRLDGRLYFDWADGLLRISGLNGLTSVGGLFLSQPFTLEELTGLQSLTTVDGDLTLSDTSLTSLAGLDGITTVTGDVWVSGNRFLPQCEVDRFVEQLGTGLSGTATSEENDETATCE